MMIDDDPLIIQQCARVHIHVSSWYLYESTKGRGVVDPWERFGSSLQKEVQGPVQRFQGPPEKGPSRTRGP